MGRTWQIELTMEYFQSRNALAYTFCSFGGGFVSIPREFTRLHPPIVNWGPPPRGRVIVQQNATRPLPHRTCSSSHGPAFQSFFDIPCSYIAINIVGLRMVNSYLLQRRAT